MNWSTFPILNESQSNQRDNEDILMRRLRRRVTEDRWSREDRQTDRRRPRRGETLGREQMESDGEGGGCGITGDGP